MNYLIFPLRRNLLHWRHVSGNLYCSRSLSFCIVGAGPAGFYCAQNLLKILPTSIIDIYEKLPVPFGLVRFGVAPDHPEVKNVINTFTKVANNPRVKFRGNISLGEDITLNDLQLSYHVVILAYGAEEDVQLNIPGESLRNVMSARRFVGWYNGLPADRDVSIDFAGSSVSIIGQGNVAVDVARILLKSVDELKSTDMTEYSLSKLSESKVKTVNLIGRRGPLQVAFTIKEFRELLKLQNTRVLIDNQLFDSSLKSVIPNLLRPRKRLTELLYDTAKKRDQLLYSEHEKTLRIIFLRSPLEFEGSTNVEGIKLAVNCFVKAPSNINVEDQRVESTNVIEKLPTDVAFKSIGYKSRKVDPAIIFKSSHFVGDFRVLPGVYSAGWLSMGPNGVILSTMTSAFNTTNLISHDIEQGVINGVESKPGYSFIQSKLKKQGVVIVDWDGWKKIDQVELSRGKIRNKPREKIVDIDELLNVGADFEVFIEFTIAVSLILEEGTTEEDTRRKRKLPKNGNIILNDPKSKTLMKKTRS